LGISAWLLDGLEVNLGRAIISGLWRLAQGRLWGIFHALDGGFKDSFPCSGGASRPLKKRLQLISQLACIEHRFGTCCIIQPKFYASPWSGY
jgi:hypothetical protein